MIDLVISFVCGMFVGGFTMTLIIAAIFYDRR